MNTRTATAAVIGLAIIGGVFTALRAQTPTMRTTWDGVYTEEQAKRGKELYDQECLACHGEEGMGEAVDIAPTLVGDAFSLNYEGQPLEVMFERFRTTMPVGKENELSRQVNADVLAYVLHCNKFPPGKTELPVNAIELYRITYHAQKPTGQSR